jgi:hypothetical protein
VSDQGGLGNQGNPGEANHGGRGGQGGRGGTGIRGEQGKRGLTGLTGLTGATGAPYSSFITRNLVRLFLLITAGNVVSFLLLGSALKTNREQEQQHRRQVAAFEQEAVETDRAFCAATNESRMVNNRQNEAMRNVLNVSRPEFLRLIPPDQALLDCSGIGNSQIDFSIQDAIRNPTTTTNRE